MLCVVEKCLILFDFISSSVGKWLGLRLMGISVLDWMVMWVLLWNGCVLLVVWCRMMLLLCGVCLLFEMSLVIVFVVMMFSGFEGLVFGLFDFMISCRVLILRIGVMLILRFFRNFLKFIGFSRDSMVWWMVFMFD